MRPLIRCSVLALITVTMLLSACDDDESGQRAVTVEQPTSSPMAAATAAAGPTTPQAAANEVARDAARETLEQVPGVAAVVAAVEGGDVDALMRLFLLRTGRCSSPASGTGRDTCRLGGVEENELIETVQMWTHQIFGGLSPSSGSGVWFDWELRPFFDSMIRDGAARLEFARLDRIYFFDEQGRLFSEDWYQLGFSTRSINARPLGGFSDSADATKSALGFAVRAGEEQPINTFALLAPYPGPGRESAARLPQPLPSFSLDVRVDQLPPDGDGSDAARAEIAAIPALRAVVEAAESADLDALLALMRTEERECFPDSVRHDFDACVRLNDAVDGRYLAVALDGPLTNSEWSLKRVRQMVDAISARTAPRLTHLARATDEDGRELFLLRFSGLPVATIDSTEIPISVVLFSGFALAVDVETDPPIIRFKWGINEPSRAFDWEHPHEVTEVLLTPAPR